MLGTQYIRRLTIFLCFFIACGFGSKSDRGSLLSYESRDGTVRLAAAVQKSTLNARKDDISLRNAVDLLFAGGIIYHRFHPTR